MALGWWRTSETYPVANHTGTRSPGYFLADSALVLSDVVDEDALPKFGHSTYKADFGIGSLKLIIEVKLQVRRRTLRRLKKRFKRTAYLTSGIFAMSRSSYSSMMTPLAFKSTILRQGRCWRSLELWMW